jgi:SAM-dependent methyltransferase
MSMPDAAEFDRWYGVIAGSAQWRTFVTEHLDLPGSVVATGFLCGEGLSEIGRRLGLREGDTLVDLGCGRGGYGLALISDSGAELVGVDISTVAIHAARADAATLALQDRARFQEGDLESTGLPDGIADSVVSVDALQFARSVPAALSECRRILRPGGRLVITTWESAGDDGRVPARIRGMDLNRDLAAAHFVDVEVLPRPRWSDAEVGLWSAARDLDPDLDPALLELQEESTALLPLATALERVLALARRPD